MYVFRTPGEKVWHIQATLVHCTVGHVHTAPAVCRTVNIRANDRMDLIHAHKSLNLCVPCVMTSASTLDPIVECADMPNLAKPSTGDS